MSITSCNEQFGLTSNAENGSHKYTRTFVVISSVKNESPSVIETATGIPARGAYYTCNSVSDYNSVCQQITTTQDKDTPSLWQVVCSYSPVPVNNNNQKTGDKGANPPTGMQDRRQWLPEISVDTIERENPVFVDTGNNKILSSTNEPIGVIQKPTNLVVTISFWTWTLDYSNYFGWNNKINSSTWWGSPAHTWKIKLRANASYEDGWVWWKKTWIFEQKYYLISGTTYQTWDERPVDMGLLQIDPTISGSVYNPLPSQLSAIRDYRGNPVRERCMLDGHGRAIGSTGSASSTPVMLGPFPIYAEAAFSSLPDDWLGSSFGGKLL
jgi:hypothetical protein